MRWLSSPKVRLALIVNGLYFISLFTPLSRHGRPHLFAHTYKPFSNGAAPVTLPDYVPLPPPSTPSQATSYENGGLIHVTLNKNLTLVRRPGRLLQLALFFHARTEPPEEPEAVDFSFNLYTDVENSCPDKCPLNIIADDMTLAPAYTRSGASPHSDSLSRSTPRDYATQSEVDQMLASNFLDIVNTSVSYEQFLEILSAKRVIVRLGPDWVELTADEIEALRDMHRRLPQPTPFDDADSE
jgi:hypothetical protein